MIQPNLHYLFQSLIGGADIALFIDPHYVERREARKTNKVMGMQKQLTWLFMS